MTRQQTVQRLFQCAQVLAACAGGREARVVAQRRGIQRAHHGLPQTLAGCRDQDLSIARAVTLVGCRDRVARAGLRWPFARQPRGRSLVGNHTESRIHQGGFKRTHALSLLPRKQGGEHPHRNPLTATQVNQRRRATGRRRVIVSRHLHDAGESLHQGIVARHRRADGSGTKGVKVVIKHLRVARARRRLADADAVRHPRSHALNDHIRGRNQRHRDRDTLGYFKIDHHAAFACANVAVGQAHALDEGRPGAGIVTLRRLYLDDVGAQLSQDHGPVRPRHVGGEIGNLHAGQRLQCWRLRWVA